MKKLFDYPILIQPTYPYDRFLQVGLAVMTRLDGIYADWRDCIERFQKHNAFVTLLSLKMGKDLTGKRRRNRLLEWRGYEKAL